MRAELSCDAYVIMPNHIHAILRITNPLGTHGRASLQASTGAAYRSPKSISSFVAGFKSAATIRVNQFRRIASPPIPTGPVWQPRFHDHIIRDGYEYQRVYEYIGHNIVNWKNDRLMQLPAVK
jgi:REP element-mobilizing transposase RayT